MISLKAGCDAKWNVSTWFAAVAGLFAFVSCTIGAHNTVWFSAAFLFGDEVTAS